MRNYNCPAYKTARSKSLRRDGKSCQMPGCSSKKTLQSHHIMTWSEAPSLRFDADNLITLCKSCHDSIKGQEGHYQALFMGIVHANNKRH